MDKRRCAVEGCGRYRSNMQVHCSTEEWSPGSPRHVFKPPLGTPPLELINRCQKCSELHRRLQKAEGALAKALKKLEAKPVNPWAGETREQEAEDRERQAAAIDAAERRRANGA